LRCWMKSGLTFQYHPEVLNGSTMFFKETTSPALAPGASVGTFYASAHSLPLQGG
jgi:hypothetical protein